MINLQQINYVLFLYNYVNLVNQLMTPLFWPTFRVIRELPSCRKEVCVLTSSRRLSQRPQGLSSRISLSSSESSPLSLGDLRSLSMLLPPDITPFSQHHKNKRDHRTVNLYFTDVFT